jgi:hypothetical protein
MEKTENTVDKRDKYLVAADRIREEIDSLEDEFAKQNIIASEEKKKADGIISKIDGAGREIRGLERDMLTKKEIKKGFLDTLKFAGFSFIPQVIVGYLISLLLSGVAPSILITIIEMILIDVAIIGILELPRVIRCRGIDIPKYEEIVAKLKNKLPALEEEKQLYTTFAVGLVKQNKRMPSMQQAHRVRAVMQLKHYIDEGAITVEKRRKGLMGLFRPEGYMKIDIDKMKKSTRNLPLFHRQNRALI